MARQGLRFGATNIVLNESFGRWLWRRGMTTAELFYRFGCPKN
jgi:hypothetical protein